MCYFLIYLTQNENENDCENNIETATVRENIVTANDSSVSDSDSVIAEIEHNSQSISNNEQPKDLYAGFPTWPLATSTSYTFTSNGYTQNYTLQAQ